MNSLKNNIKLEIQVHQINQKSRAKEKKPEVYVVHGTLIYKHP